VQPGWYSDPYGQAPLRWWDGTAWTSHLAGAPAVGSPGAYVPITPQEDLQTERRWSQFGRWAFVALGAVAVAACVYSGPHSGRALRSWFDDCRVAIDSGGQCSASVDFGFWNYYNVLFWIPQIFMMLWLYQVATIARRLNLPARRRTGWAIAGFFVPIVNFWFPYQVARDCLPPDHPGRSTVALWWGMTMASLATTITVVLVSAVSGLTAGTICGVALAAVPVFAAVAGYRMVSLIEQAHRDLITTHAR